MLETRFRGAITALVTPFGEKGKLDEKALKELVEWQIQEGIHGLVPVGTTGESPTLSHHEHKRVVELVIETAKGRIPIIAGAGSNSTEEAIGLAQHAEKAGANAILAVTPYYNKPNQPGLEAHFSAVAQAIKLPIFIYNIPPRSVIDMTPETIARVRRKHPNIAGVKDATADLSRVTQQRSQCGKDFIQLSGEDITALGFNAHGGNGCISVTANVAPRLCAEFQQACLSGEYDKALELQDRLAPLHRALFVEPNPVGAKQALAILGKIKPGVRLPLVEPKEETVSIIRDAMKHAGLIQ